MKLGLLLPHFGRHASSSLLLDGIAEIDRLGFDSVWVRDHVAYRPHDFEDPDRTFLEPFTVLAAVAARSSRLILGTATLIPYRHPIQAALQIASLTAYAAPERLILGWGSGNDAREFVATGLSADRRGARLEENVAAIRMLGQNRPVSYSGSFYSFEDVHIHPPTGHVRFWYGGGTTRAMHRTVRRFEGLLASRIPASMLRGRVAELRAIADEAESSMPEVGLITLVSPARTVEEGLGAFDTARIRADTERRFPGIEWSERDGFDGVLVAGPPAHMVAQLRAFEEAGVSHFIFDLRARFAEWEAVIHELAANVLPLVRR